MGKWITDQNSALLTSPLRAIFQDNLSVLDHVTLTGITVNRMRQLTVAQLLQDPPFSRTQHASVRPTVVLPKLFVSIGHKFN
jgi:hypothetical protein